MNNDGAYGFYFWVKRLWVRTSVVYLLFLLLLPLSVETIEPALFPSSTGDSQNF
jgi:hypothetical protein